MSFWQTDSRTPYGQKSISIVAENGKQFSPNSKITIVVSPDVAFFQPSESYLSLRVRVDGPAGSGIKNHGRSSTTSTGPVSNLDETNS
jgi:hypothetical protein